MGTRCATILIRSVGRRPHKSRHSATTATTTHELQRLQNCNASRSGLHLLLAIVGVAVAAATLATAQTTQPLVRITSLNVQCGETSMTVDIQFSQTFQGVIFSKGYFSHHECVYVQPGENSAGYRFVIPYDGCGTTAGGTALSNTSGRPAQFLRSLSFEDGLMLNGTAQQNSDNNNNNITTTGYIVDRTRRSAADDNNNNTNSTTAALQPLARAFYDGGEFSGGDPNAREFISAHNMFNGDESANFVPGGGGGEQSNFGNGDNLKSRFAPPFPTAQQQPQPRPPPTTFQQQPTSSFVQRRQQIPMQKNNDNLPVLQESVPDERQSSFYPQQTAPVAVTAAPAVVVAQPTAPAALQQGTKFMENVLIIQFDANIQEIWDVAKALRCEWHDNYHKRVTYKPMNVGSLDIVEAAFAGDNIGVWMTVQQGQGPFAPEVNGIVRIGQQLTLTIGIQDPSQQFDMRVLNCIASDGTRPTIQLVDEYGCVVRPKIMAPFQKTRNVGPQASVVSYASFQAFKFPDSVDVNIECSVEVCKHGCPRQCFVEEKNAVDLGARRAGRADGGVDDAVPELMASESTLNNSTSQLSNSSGSSNTTSSLKRERRQAGSSNEVELTRKIKVVSMNDMAPFMEALRAVNENFSSLAAAARKLRGGMPVNIDDDAKTKLDLSFDAGRTVCIAPSLFIASAILLFAALVVTLLVFVFLCARLKRQGERNGKAATNTENH